MKVCLANDIICRYVTDVIQNNPEVRGIYIAGSYLELNPNDELPVTSDVDLVFIVEQAEQKTKIGKIRYQGLLLEISYLKPADFVNQERVLLTHYIGNALIHNSILYDPDNILRNAQQVIRQKFLSLFWVNRRIDDMLDRIKENLENFHVDLQNPVCINSYLFTLGISVYPFLLADCRNLTVRRRYTAARKVLFSFGYESMYHKLIDLIAGKMNSTQLDIHMKAMQNVFDHAALSEGKSAEYVFRNDIRPHTRQIAIDGCYELIESKYPNESVFWIGATFSRCYIILQLDYPNVHIDALSNFLRSTGIHSADDMLNRLDALRQLLPAIEETAKVIAINSQNRLRLEAWSDGCQAPK